jgi:DNA-binding MarR family transcriptional regulator
MKPEETVDFQIKYAWQLISRMYNEVAQKYGSTWAAGNALLNIDLEGTPSTSLGPKMGMEATSLSRLLKNLEEKGMIVRSPHPEDKRIVLVKLTEQGLIKREEARLRNLERSNMQYVVAQVSKKNDPISARKRGVLSMPAPAVSDGELEKVAKIAKEHTMEHGAIVSMNGGDNATDTLLGDYTDRPLPTPMRTPLQGTGSAMSSRDVVMREASNLRMLERGQTPLLGEFNPILIEGGAGTGVGLKRNESDLLGEYSNNYVRRKPNEWLLAILYSIEDSRLSIVFTGSATPMLTGNMSNNRIGTVNETPMTLAPRDQLGLNRPNSEMRSVVAGDYAGDDVSVSATSFATSVGVQSMSIREMAKAERRAIKRARKELEIALANLPAPQFEYELEAPEMVTDEDEGNQSKMDFEKDAAEIEAEKIAQLEKEAAKLYEKRSSVMKRKGLPRPIGAIVNDMVLEPASSTGEQSAEDVAQNLIREEMLLLLQHDAYKFPILSSSDIEPSKKKNKVKTLHTMNVPLPPEKPLQIISDDNFEAAKEMMDAEVEIVIQEKRSLAFGTLRCIQTEEVLMQMLINQAMKSSMDGDKSQECNDLKKEYSIFIDTIKALKKQNDKLESKLSIINGGYMKRCDDLCETIQKSFDEVQNSKTEESVYKALMRIEKRGISSRDEKLQEEIEELERIEARLQKRYGDLLHEKSRRKILMRQQEQSASSQ